MDVNETASFRAGDFEYLPARFLGQFQALAQRLDSPLRGHARRLTLILQCLRLIDRFYSRITAYLTEQQQELVTGALLASFEAHGLVLRKSKDALFFEHPLATADYLARFKLDPPTLAAALLHDVAEDTTFSTSQIVERFGPEVGKLVEGVTRLQATGKQVTSRAQQDALLVDSTNRLLQFMVQDVRVVLVKLADRRHNMQTVAALPRRKQEEKALEVLRVYAPLAYRLGMWDVKSELEELALKTLHPVLYNCFHDLMARRSQDQEPWLAYVQGSLLDTFKAARLDATVEASPEQIYTLYRDYKAAGRLPDRLPDLMRIAVIVNDRCECYRALCIAHDLWSPVPGTFDDYIARPRENLYQALHTTVFAPGGRLLKIRFRTHEMHQIAHHGILARWSANLSDTAKGFEGLQRLMNRLRPVQAIAERGERFSAYREALTDQIQVFTPEGELVELPPGSTPLDLAYQIHTELGDEADGAIINGTQSPLNTRLKSGDQVRIERRRGGLPRREWLDEDLGFAHTMYARSRIRRAFRRLDGARAIAIGREAVKREMVMMGIQDYDLTEIAGQLGHETVDELLLAIARADLMPYRVAEVAMRPVWNALEGVPVGEEVVSANGGVQVRGLPGRPVKHCATCKPSPGDPVLGNLLRGGQVTVHRLDCRHIAGATRGGEHLNLVEVDWIREPLVRRQAHIRVAAIDRSGLTYNLSQVLELEHINICEMYARTHRQKRVGLLACTVDVIDLRQLSRVLHRIAQIPDVKAVQRSDTPSQFRDDAMKWAEAQVLQSA